MFVDVVFVGVALVVVVEVVAKKSMCLHFCTRYLFSYIKEKYFYSSSIYRFDLFDSERPT